MTFQMSYPSPGVSTATSRRHSCAKLRCVHEPWPEVIAAKVSPKVFRQHRMRPRQSTCIHLRPRSVRVRGLSVADRRCTQRRGGSPPKYPSNPQVAPLSIHRLRSVGSPSCLVLRGGRPEDGSRFKETTGSSSGVSVSVGAVFAPTNSPILCTWSAPRGRDTTTCSYPRCLIVYQHSVVVDRGELRCCNYPSSCGQKASWGGVATRSCGGQCRPHPTGHA